MADFIVKFNDNQTLKDWLDVVNVSPEYRNIRFEPSPIFSDVVLHDVTEEQVPRLRDLAQNRARFIRDFEHDLFRP